MSSRAERIARVEPHHVASLNEIVRFDPRVSHHTLEGRIDLMLAYVEAGLGPHDGTHQAQQMLDALGLTGGEEPRRLSGGEARRAALARAITLVESRRPDHREQAQELLVELLPEGEDAAKVLSSRLHDREYAAVEGHPDIIVHGPLQGAWLSQYVTDWAGPRGRMLSLTWQNRRSALRFNSRPGNLTGQEVC